MKAICAFIAISLFAVASAEVADIVLEPEYGLMSENFLQQVQEKAKQSTWTVSIMSHLTCKLIKFNSYYRLERMISLKRPSPTSKDLWACIRRITCTHYKRRRSMGTWRRTLFLKISTQERIGQNVQPSKKSETRDRVDLAGLSELWKLCRIE